MERVTLSRIMGSEETGIVNSGARKQDSQGPGEEAGGGEGNWT